MMALGRLEKIDSLRKVWPGEATDFTPWLAEEENLTLLGNTIGLDLEREAVEKNVGPFRADILAKDTATDTWVLIENQIEPTNHTHLGQLLTYAAGLSAVTIVWIAEHFRDEHRAALDWLNNVTDEHINFFGLEIELWRIGNSPIAPKFNVISQPNDWTRTVASTRQAQQSGELSEIKQLQQEYWSSFKDYLEAKKSFIKPQKPPAQHWTTFSIGRSNFTLNAAINTRDKVAALGLTITGQYAKTYYRLLLNDKEKIETEIGQPLSWRELPGKKSSDIGISRRGFDLMEHGEWQAQHEWFYQNLEAFHKVFSARVKTLNAANFLASETNTDYLSVENLTIGSDDTSLEKSEPLE